MTTTERDFLRSLSNSGEGGIAESRVPRRCFALLEKLMAATCVRRCRGVRGAVYVVTDPITLDRFIQHEVPLGLDARVAESASRAEAVLRVGDAKAVASGDCMGVFVRSTKPGITLSSHRGTVDVSGLTSIASGAAVLLENGVDWTCSGQSVALIENAEAFWHCEQVLSDIDLAVWTVGRMSSRRLIAWLASAGMQHCQYTHWGDYDPTGVAEYIRLCNACPGRVSMWIPDDLEPLLQRYGKRSLLLRQGNQRLYARIRRMTADPVVARLVALFDIHHKGLEQEILLAGTGIKSPHKE